MKNKINTNAHLTNNKRILFISYVPFMNYIYNCLKGNFTKFHVIQYEVWNRLGLLSKIALARKYDYIHSFWAKNSYNDIIACKLSNTKFINHYIGSDVLLVSEGRKNIGNKARYIHRNSYKTLAVSKHLIDELDLEQISKAELFEPFYYEESEIIKNLIVPKEKIILSYIPEGKEDFYGYDFIKTAAENLLEFRFKIIGHRGIGLERTDNIQFCGWVNDVDFYLDECFVYIRNTKHDGLPNLVLQSLLRGKHVLYPHKFPNTIDVNMDNLKNILNQNELNLKGREYIKANYSKERLLDIFNTLYK
ncbi:MAG: hypothetical protein KKD38_05660 [Candidatus Delongbacteria bacterium]|nr:hypothetical protein [Candidatus Delongbacteria bacterium]MCG2761173.1 hypothetical protein [Candidatus Delongbacteria bacterium]